VNGQLAENGAKVWRGIVVDATIIHAPSSTMNKHKQRNPQMRRNHRADSGILE
jgi:IS5 family transposase